MGKELSAVLDFTIDDEVVKARISGRWIHKASGRSYHTIFAPPKVTGKDDITGEPLIQRSDDKAETVASRLKSFHEETEPVLAFYAKAKKLKTINSDQKIDKVWADTKAVLEMASGNAPAPARLS